VETEEAAERSGEKNCNGFGAKNLPSPGANQWRQGVSSGPGGETSREVLK
jgi:hypothetical protein